MLGFMDYVQNAFYEASHWNRDNSYGSLEDTARSIFISYPFFFFSSLSLRNKKKNPFY